jgi:oxygen-independent coproporphyrinogen-3 oxidase
MLYQNPLDINAYYENVKNRVIFPQKEELSNQRIIQDYLMMGLRLREGINLQEFNERFQIPLMEIYREQINKLIKIKMLTLQEGNLALTEQALFVSNRVIGDLIL